PSRFAVPRLVLLSVERASALLSWNLPRSEAAVTGRVQRVAPAGLPLDGGGSEGNDFRLGLTFCELSTTLLAMPTFSTRDAAKQLGLDVSTLSRYITAKKVPAPKTLTTGGITVHIWTRRDIERVRKLLPKLKNGRKLRYKKTKKEK